MENSGTLASEEVGEMLETERKFFWAYVFYKRHVPSRRQSLLGKIYPDLELFGSKLCRFKRKKAYNVTIAFDGKRGLIVERKISQKTVKYSAKTS